MVQKIKDFLASTGKAKILNLVILLLIVAAVPLTVFLSQQQQDIRQRASETRPLTAPLPSPILTGFGKAAKFARGNFYISAEKVISQSFSLLNPKSTMTLEAWVKLDELIPQTESSYIIYKLADYNYQGSKVTSAIYYLQYYQDKFTVLITDTTKNLKGFASASVPSSENVGKWNHIAGVYDGQKVKIFINGIEKDSRDLEQSSTLLDDSLPFYIQGNPYLSTSKSIPVTIDEVRISNIARYTSNFNVQLLPFISDQNTSLLWHLDGSELGDFEIVRDSSGKNNDGIITGNTPDIRTNIQFINSTIVSPSLIATPTPAPLTITPSSSLSPILTPTKLSTTILLDGVNLNPPYTPRAKEFRIQVLNASNQLVKTVSQNISFTKGSGFKAEIDLGNLPTSTYTFKFKTRGYLRTAVINQNIISGIINSIPSVTLLAGDIHENNRVNSNDYRNTISGAASYVSCFNQTTTLCLNNADLNLDRKVDNADYSLLMSNMGKTGQ